MKKIVFDFWVGLFVVVGFFVVLFLVLKVGNMSLLLFQLIYLVRMKFDNIGGLKLCVVVKSVGVVVGCVKLIGFDMNMYQVFVMIDVDGQY